MHFCLVCNMNKFGRVIVVFIVVLATTGAAEIKSKNNNTSSSANSFKETTLTTKWKQPTTTEKWKPSTTTKWSTTTSTKATPTNRVSSVNHGVYAVASISGVDARNGRLSSINGIKIYPPVDSSMVKSDDKGNFIFKSTDGKMPMPITITKQGEGVSGTIRILPGSVSVSSSATSTGKSGPATAVASFNPWPETYMKPIMNDIYFPPFPTFPTIPDPVFNTRIPDTFHMRIPDIFPYMRFSEPTFQTRIQDPWFEKDRFKSMQPKHDMFKTNWFYPSFNPFINYW